MIVDHVAAPQGVGEIEGLVEIGAERLLSCLSIRLRREEGSGGKDPPLHRVRANPRDPCGSLRLMALTGKRQAAALAEWSALAA